MTGCPSELALDLFDAGAARPEERRAIEAHLPGCAACAARLAALRRGFAAFPGADERRMLAAIRRGSSVPRRPRWLLGLLPLAAAAGALALVLARPAAAPAIREKGGPATLHVYRAAGEGAVEALSGDPFHPGDRVEFTVDLARPALVRLVGVDAKGALYDIWPADGGARRLEAGPSQRIPGAERLDRAPGDETVHLVTCPAAGPAPRCESRGPGEPPACSGGCETSAFVLRKVP